MTCDAGYLPHIPGARLFHHEVRQNTRQASIDLPSSCRSFAGIILKALFTSFRSAVLSAASEPAAGRDAMDALTGDENEYDDVPVARMGVTLRNLDRTEERKIWLDNLFLNPLFCCCESASWWRNKEL